jgi:hypothetical protein
VLDPEHDPGQQQRKADFVAATNDKSDLNPHAVMAPIALYADGGHGDRRQSDHRRQF